MNLRYAMHAVLLVVNKSSCCLSRRDFDRPNTFAVRFSLVQHGVCLHNKF